MPFADHQPDPTPEPSSMPAAPRPAWLVGTDDSMAGRAGGEPERPRGRPRDPLLEVDSDSRPTLPTEGPAGPVAWSAAASSIPRMPGRARVTPIPSVARSGDELEESDSALDLAAGDRWAQSPEAALAPLVEPWWVILVDDLRTKRSTQLIAVASVLAIAGWMFFQSARETATIPLSKIRGNPTLFDGQSVVVRGRIGEVYSVGGGYAFYLMQGRDTIVAFTTTRVPTPRQKVVVRGQVTTGFLDGTPRQALFESSAK